MIVADFNLEDNGNKYVLNRIPRYLIYVKVRYIYKLCFLTRQLSSLLLLFSSVRYGRGVIREFRVMLSSQIPNFSYLSLSLSFGAYIYIYVHFYKKRLDMV